MDHDRLGCLGCCCTCPGKKIVKNNNLVDAGSGLKI